MTTPDHISSSRGHLCGLAAAALFVVPLAATLHAQQGESFESPSTRQGAAVSSAPRTLNMDLQAALHAPFDLSGPDTASSSSSLSSSEIATSIDRVNLTADPSGSPGMDGNMQPPPRRRRYGRPNYNDRWHNSDGSSRVAFVAGVGLNVPAGDATSNYLSTNFRFEVGGGINFSKKLAVMLQFDYDRFGVPGKILRNQQSLYNNLGFVDSTGTPVDFSGLDGNAHIWSFSVNPTINFYQGETVGAYAVVGGGFYHKVTNFTLPQLGTGYNYYYGPYQYTYNQNIDTYTSNAPGVTGGIGATYKFSRFANQRFFAEARYVHTFNQYRAGDPNYSGAGTPYNLYPPNSNESTYIPITVGLRF